MFWKDMEYKKIIDFYYPTESKVREILLTHSRGVAAMALECLKAHPELVDVDAERLEAAAMLHDIGICECDANGIECYGTQPYICHGQLGGRMVREYAQAHDIPADVAEVYARVCERHTGAGLTAKEIVTQGLPLPAKDWLPETTLEQLVCYADKFYSKTHPDVRKAYEKAERSLAKFGEEGLERFRSWHKRFAVAD